MNIKEVSTKLSLSADTLRYYERIGLIPPVARNKNGIRVYDEDDCAWIEFIKCMRSSGLPIEALIEYVALFQQGEETRSARKDILVEQRDILVDKIAELQATVVRLNGKIEMYEKGTLPKENDFIKR